MHLDPIARFQDSTAAAIDVIRDRAAQQWCDGRGAICFSCTLAIPCPRGGVRLFTVTSPGHPWDGPAELLDAARALAALWSATAAIWVVPTDEGLAVIAELPGFRQRQFSARSVPSRQSHLGRFDELDGPPDEFDWITLPTNVAESIRRFPSRGGTFAPTDDFSAWIALRPPETHASGLILPSPSGRVHRADVALDTGHV